ncbi:MAG: penicillin-binding protein 1C, partial [Burkholderiales bacterium]
WAPGCGDADPRRALRVTGLEPGTVARAAPGRREVVLQVRAVGSRDALGWLLDGAWVGASEPGSPSLRLVLDRPGEHALTVVDAQGRWDRVPFVVR